MPSAEFTLGLRSLYIIPSRFGALWLAASGLLLLVAIQTGSNSTLLLGFVLLAVMFLAMHLTHDSLQGLQLRCGQPGPAFAGETAMYPVLLESQQRRPRLQCRLRGEPMVVCDRIPVGVTRVVLPWSPSQRGWQQPPQLQIETIAPLGLFICWSRWLPEAPQLIWPRRRSGPVGESKPAAARDGLEEWHDLRPMREGERLAMIDWRGAARGQQLQAKLFSDPVEPETMLEPAPGVPTEQALEHLADRIWRLHHRGECYGLRLASINLAAAKGVRHRDACLEALATA